jgi:hypothetical protein
LCRVLAAGCSAGRMDRVAVELTPQSRIQKYAASQHLLKEQAVTGEDAPDMQVYTSRQVGSMTVCTADRFVLYIILLLP